MYSFFLFFQFFNFLRQQNISKMDNPLPRNPHVWPFSIAIPHIHTSTYACLHIRNRNLSPHPSTHILSPYGTYEIFPHAFFSGKNHSNHSPQSSVIPHTRAFAYPPIQNTHTQICAPCKPQIEAPALWLPTAELRTPPPSRRSGGITRSTPS